MNTFLAALLIFAALFAAASVVESVEKVVPANPPTGYKPTVQAVPYATQNILTITRPDILPPPIIPLVPWKEMLEIIAVSLQIIFKAIEPLPATIAANINWFVNFLRACQQIKFPAYY